MAPKAQCYRGWCRTSCVWLHSEPADLDLEDVNSKRRLHTFRGSSLILHKCKFHFDKCWLSSIKSQLKMFLEHKECSKQSMNVILQFESLFHNIRAHVYRYVTLRSSHGTPNSKTVTIMLEEWTVN